MMTLTYIAVSARRLYGEGEDWRPAICPFIVNVESLNTYVAQMYGSILNVSRQLRDMEKQVQVMKVDEVTSQTVALTSAEAADIQELLAAYHNSLQVNIDKHVSRDQASFLDLINIAELSIRRVIAMAKQVDACSAYLINLFIH